MTKMLVIDDKKFILEAFKECFMDYEMFYASSLKESYKITDENDLSIIITDVDIIDGNGLELLEYVYDKKPSVFRVAMSGMDKDKVLNMLSSKDIVQLFIKKPFNLGTLNKVRKLIEELVILPAS